LRDLAVALRARLDELARSGLFLEHVSIAAGLRTPLVAASGHGIVLAGDAPLLLRIAGGLRYHDFGARAALDALAAHVLTVLNVAHTTVTDDVERVGLGHLLARPG
jgi:hypothetical protein